MNKSICGICHKEFSVTPKGKVRKHGYRYKKIQKEWKGFGEEFEIKKNFYIKIKPACLGSGLKAENIIIDEG